MIENIFSSVVFDTNAIQQLAFFFSQNEIYFNIFH